MWSPSRTGGIGRRRAERDRGRAPRGGSVEIGSSPPPLPLQGQEDGEGAAAEGAEESSAPEAVRC